MTITNHAATGALVATAINRPILSLPAALASHFVIDMVPHWSYRTKLSLRMNQLIKLIDLSLALYILLVLAVAIDASQRLIIAGGFLGVLPDLMWAPHIFYGRMAPVDGSSLLHRLRRAHLKIQWSETFKGIYIEVIWLIATLILLFRL